MTYIVNMIIIRTEAMTNDVRNTYLSSLVGVHGGHWDGGVGGRSGVYLPCMMITL